MTYKSWLLTICIILIGFVHQKAYSNQADGKLIIQVRVDKGSESLPNAQIIVYKDFRKERIVRTNKKGIFTLELDLNKIYTLAFSKPDYVTKKIKVNTNVPGNKRNTWQLGFSVGLFKMYPGLDVSALEGPVTKIRYKEEREDFGYDERYTAMMMEKVDKILAQLKRLREKAYRDLIQKGDKHFNQKKYLLSLEFYRRALSQKPDEEYPREKIKKAQELLKNNLKYQKLYRKAIAKADSLFKQKSYEKARSTYFEAVRYDHSREYPVEQIGKIDNILKKRSEGISTDKIKERYHQYIELADKKFREDNFAPARICYRNALGVYPDKRYPKKRIDTINQILAKKAQSKAKNNKYQNLIDRADERFSENQYNQAKKLYNMALDIMPNRAYPRNQISYIKDVLERNRAVDRKYKSFIDKADEYFYSGMYWLARNAYKHAMKIKPEKDYPRRRIGMTNGILQSKHRQERYRYTIAKADQLYDQQSYQASLKKYEEALDIKPSSDYAQNRINRINDKLAGLRAEKQKKQKPDNRYKKIIEMADQLFRSGEYEEAKSNYQKAKDLNPGENYPEKRLGEIRELLVKSDESGKSDKMSEQKTKEVKESKEKEAEQTLPEMNFTDDDAKTSYFEHLAEKYPEGITVEHYSLDRREITRVIVNYDGIATDYREVKHLWGASYYFRNGQAISRDVFDVETRERDQ
ncbi:MAG: hypothetical protein KGY70_03095 [Bacteroidales bacterium]|nr:hypothetical protein [Bacteroidales bacterium]